MRTTFIFLCVVIASGLQAQCGPSNSPTFSVSSPQNFTLGCSTKSVVTMAIVNASSPTGAALSFTVLGPGGSTGVGSFSTSTPGTFTFIVHDNSNGCETWVPLTVASNTVAPTIDSVTAPTHTLNCNILNATLRAFTTSQNVAYNWAFPGIPGINNLDSFPVSANIASPSATFIGNYSLSVTDLNNSCASKTVIPIYQNLFPPKAKIITGGTNAISCPVPTVMLTNGSGTGIPLNGPFPYNQQVIGYLWEGPSPQNPVSISSWYVGAFPGVYTLTAKDLNNGCTSKTTAVIADNRVYPVVNMPSWYCLTGGSAILSPAVSSTTTNLTYSWTASSNATVSGQNTPYLTTNTVGGYTVTVTNTVNGCSSMATTTVGSCTDVSVPEKTHEAGVRIYPNPGNGICTITSASAVEKVEIYNTLGAQIMQGYGNAGKFEIDITDQPSGVYFVFITTQNSDTRIYKIVKE